MLQSVQMGIVPNVTMTEKSNIGQGLKVRKQEKYHPTTIKVLHVSGLTHSFCLLPCLSDSELIS